MSNLVDSFLHSALETAVQTFVGGMEANGSDVCFDMTAYRQHRLIQNLHHRLWQFLTSSLRDEFPFIAFGLSLTQAIDAYAATAIQVIETNLQSIVYNAYPIHHRVQNWGYQLCASADDVANSVRQTLQNNPDMVNVTSQLADALQATPKNNNDNKMKAMKALKALKTVKGRQMTSIAARDSEADCNDFYHSIMRERDHCIRKLVDAGRSVEDIVELCNEPWQGVVCGMGDVDPSLNTARTVKARQMTTPTSRAADVDSLQRAVIRKWQEFNRTRREAYGTCASSQLNESQIEQLCRPILNIKPPQSYDDLLAKWQRLATQRCHEHPGNAHLTPQQRQRACDHSRVDIGANMGGGDAWLP